MAPAGYEEKYKELELGKIILKPSNILYRGIFMEDHLKF